MKWLGIREGHVYAVVLLPTEDEALGFLSLKSILQVILVGYYKSVQKYRLI
jgi:hypothetical protein